mgnify:CR=1 FL=1
MVKLNLCIAKELLLILLICNKNENKSHFILFFANFFVPLRMDSVQAVSRHFSKKQSIDYYCGLLEKA